MRNLRLRPGISFACVDDELIFLDLRQDRYFALRGSPADILRSRIQAPSLAFEEAEAERLLQTGLFESGDGPAALQPAPSQLPASSLFEESPLGGLPHGATLVETAARLIAIRHDLRRGRLFERVRIVAAAKTNLAQTSAPARVLALARRFNKARPLVPLAPNCLSDSLAFSAYLLHHAAAADLVFGVKLRPFAAHAWLQTPEMVLSDHVDHVHEYTPVLVL